ncbi:hypothetical protein CISG_06671 [Coccidioides immitis RMSCC 3703]|uniref:Uncharacterized protein n=1 Tax=Coccidioides immitis RMSCC 3703 TaxID=454286 RepID=A0A0J8QX01_COCIT|nr:hypothetical protein CISG_06671 [Coccidioides immitis RMSCC 3703]
MASAPRERRSSMGAPISELQGPVGPGFSRPKHKRTFTGFGPRDIKKVVASIPEPQRQAWRKFAPQAFKTKEEFEGSMHCVKNVDADLQS